MPSLNHFMNQIIENSYQNTKVKFRKYLIACNRLLVLRDHLIKHAGAQLIAQLNLFSFCYILSTDKYKIHSTNIATGEMSQDKYL